MTNEGPRLAYPVGALPTRKPQRFALKATAAERAAIAADMDLIALSQLEFEGEIRAEGRSDFRLEGRLRAAFQQPCVVTLAPVAGRADVTVLRRYSADMVMPDAEESEMPEDDTTEPLPEVIDVAGVAIEELALSLPPYPRAPGAELGEAVFAAEGNAPLKDADLKPFAGLQALKDRMKGDK
ncbi:YceD family protein [Falsirhodobacter halotolerans]|uniref:YceD family protein n=1 Tax=Falsirhodobacter halotolerans TaxID=1146892 RepID=UPI001FD10F88|nr:DUF177 domain-containing protein [Falsirhodobacter halotolerans]MCJ8139740.1 DUF177 domain-containing protein [Falsirhodobacter halotolerans]